MRLAQATLIVAVSLLASLPAGRDARAEDGTYPDRFMIRLGGYQVQNADHLIRLDANDAPVGVYIDFADTLGGSTKTNVLRVDGLYRFNDHHGLGFSWYALRFNGNRRLETTISWGGEDYTVGTTVDSQIDIDVYKVNYQYSLINTKEVELGTQIGLHVLDTFLAISATGTGQARGEGVTAPLPVFGLSARYNFTPRLSTYFAYQWFFVSYDNRIEGGLQDFLLGLEYRLTRHFAFGGAINRFSMNISAEDENETAYLNTKWGGVMLYGSLYF